MFRNPDEDACSFIGYIAGKHYPSSNNNISKPQGTTIVVPTLNVGASNKRYSVNISASNSVGCASVAKRTKTQEFYGKNLHSPINMKLVFLSQGQLMHAVKLHLFCRPSPLLQT